MGYHTYKRSKTEHFEKVSAYSFKESCSVFPSGLKRTPLIVCLSNFP